MPFEQRHEPLLPRRAFLRRFLRGAALGGLLILLSLGLGALGYRAIAGMGWIDAVYNAGMILTGMGPATPLTTNGAKLFATAYAIFSGVVFLTSAGVVVAPLVHRFLHRFHADLEEEASSDEPAGRAARDADR